VPPAIDLAAMTEAEKDALILSLLPLVQQLKDALAEIALLKARIEELTRPPKTPDNSSTPPSKSAKPDRSVQKELRRRRGRPGVTRALTENPDRIVQAHLEACPSCQADFPAGAQTPQSVYDRIELPPVRPHVTRVQLFGGRCACCGVRATAAAPEGLEGGSPFGRSIEAMVVYLHYAHAIGLERLRALMGEVFGLSISEGALCNILARARAPLGVAAATITAGVREARVVCSDETSVRVVGKTWWEWVFVTKAAVLHLIRPSRGRAVPEAVFAGARPEVWVSDALGSQRGHGERWQMCLAHLLRDAQWSIDCGDAGFSVRFKLWLLRALAIGRRREGLRDSTLVQYRADLERRLDRLMAHAVPQAREGEKLRRRIGRCREHLTVFVTDREVPPTNNISERALRPSVVFRKVTNGFRAEWGAETYAAFRSVVSTAKICSQTVLAAVRDALHGETAGAPG
jgi:transposase